MYNYITYGMIIVFTRAAVPIFDQFFTIFWLLFDKLLICQPWCLKQQVFKKNCQYQGKVTNFCQFNLTKFNFSNLAMDFSISEISLNSCPDVKAAIMQL